MKCIFAVTAIATFALAELLPSNSYLPPPPVGRSDGYARGPQPTPWFPGPPQIIAARKIDQAERSPGNGFSRISPHNPSVQGRLGVGSRGYENSVSPGPNDIDTSVEPANYNFGYMVSDFKEGTDFGHHEERLEEKAQGEYHVVLPDGRKQTVSYKADGRGFKPKVSYQDSDVLVRSEGYDANAHSPRNGNGHPNGANGYKNGANGYQNGANGYQNGAIGYQNGVDGYKNGANGYQNGGHEDTRSY